MSEEKQVLTVVDEPTVVGVQPTASAPTAMQTALERALESKPAAIGVKSPMPQGGKAQKDTQTLLSAGQQAQISEHVAETFKVIVGFQQTRRVEGKAVHA